ncbi:histone-lysine N-methyltransferase SETMAR [Plakobranchus ocellatus]|uniref:Histone-lysine N-methyltransferase SETMAR n=1 Tax=Plakobranchus ocellatus TaxID=259542 RepID=A0AAV4CGM3_9GAST|nr:histone-lysine N-methyltransferase SETMAR [Plakobranchus ocellatus]
MSTSVSESIRYVPYNDLTLNCKSDLIPLISSSVNYLVCVRKCDRQRSCLHGITLASRVQHVPGVLLMILTRSFTHPPIHCWRPANLTQQWLQRYGWEILPHPAHSPDLAPSDFHLFGPLKRLLGGMAFETEDDLISKLWNWFDNLDVDFFRLAMILALAMGALIARKEPCSDYGSTYSPQGTLLKLREFTARKEPCSNCGNFNPQGVSL